jgi:hypothetical protein
MLTYEQGLHLVALALAVKAELGFLGIIAVVFLVLF